MDDNVRPINSITENVNGLFGAAMIDDGRTIWCRGKQVRESLSAGDDQSEWRPMTMADVETLAAAGAIDEDTVERMQIRLLK